MSRAASLPCRWFGNLTAFGQIDVLRYSFAGARKGAYPGPQGPVAQLVSAPPCHGGGRGFESRRGRVSGDESISPTKGQVAQSVVAFA